MARNYYRDQEYRDQNSTARSQYAGRGQGYRQERSGYEGRERDSSDLGPQTAEGIGDYGGYGDDRERAGGYGENFRQGAFYGQRERSYGDFRGGDWQSNRGGISNYSGEPSAGGADRSGRSYGDAARSGSQYGYGATRPSEFSNYTTGSTYGADYGSGAYGRGEYYGGAGQQFGRQYGQQSFRGRGPKGYERSDERLKEIISERLSDDPGIDASDITVEVADKIVKLTGTVSSRRVKYEVEELIERCGGVKDIENQLRVQSPQSWSSQSQQAGGGSSYGTSAGRDFLTRNDGESGSTSGSSTRHS